jgi:hypothetical protein
MFTLIVTCPRRVAHAHTFSFSCMRRQQTLGTFLLTSAIYFCFTRLRLAKFFAMPPGKKAPAQQSSLTELWASKPKKQNNPATSTAATSSGHPRLEPKLDSHGTADAVGPTTSSSEERAYCLYSCTTRICTLIAQNANTLELQSRLQSVNKNL